MRERIQFVIAWLALMVGIVSVHLLSMKNADADVVYLVGDDRPKFGRLVSRGENGGVMFRVRDENNSYSEHQYSASEVETLIVNIDEQRLGQLNPDRLEAYRDYAEELASQKQDPEARDLAIRLYLIVATTGSSRNETDLVESSLAGLVPLARNEKEESDFELLRVLHTRGQWQKLVFTEPIEKVESESKGEDKAKSELVRAIRMIRKEGGAGAMTILRSRAVLNEVAKWPQIMSVEDLIATAGSSRLTLVQLRKLLTLELAVQDSPSQHRETNNVSNWAEQAEESMGGWGRLPRFRNVTEFNPDESLFGQGFWTKPVKADSAK